MADEKRFTRAQLAAFNGENGRPAYVAYKGRVIDVSTSKMWRGGMHMKRHAAGQDLTAQISAAPHDTDVLDRFPQVGVLVEETAAQPGQEAQEATGQEATREQSAAPGKAVASGLPGFIERLLERYPFLQRHPHPMTVHFPIVFFISAPLFTALYLVTRIDAFEVTALNCLGAALLFSLVVIPTGLFTWWVNYGAQKMRAITIKLTLSIVQFFVGLAAFVWRLADPAVAGRGDAATVLYAALVFLLLPMIFVVAWYGATLTFPLRKDKRARRRKDS